MMVCFYPAIVTILLLALTYSFADLISSITVFSVTAVVTCICFNLQIQLELETAFYYIGRLKKSVSDKFLKSTQVPEEDVTHIHRKEDGLRNLPKPIANVLRKFIKAVLRDFIESWYVTLGPDEKDFLEEVKIALEYVSSEAYSLVGDASVHDLAVNLIRMFQRHVKVFNECRDAVNRKYPGIGEEDYEICISELYEARIVKHTATTSKGAEIDYLKTLLDMLLFKLVPDDVLSCEGGRFMLREILVIQLLEPLLNDFTSSHFVNEALIDILEPAVPLKIVIERYEEAMNQIEDDEEGYISEKDGETSGQETSYESSPEDISNSSEFKSPMSDRATDSARKDSSALSVSSMEINSKVANIKHSPSSYDSADENAVNQVIRFNKLEARSSEPVYGSTSVRLHETSKPMNLPIAFNYNSSAYMDTSKSVAPSEAADSGFINSTERQRHITEYGTPTSEFANSGYVYDHFAEATDDINTDSVFENALPETEDVGLNTVNLSSSWGYCPPPSAEVFRKRSFHDMSKKQDEKTERVKAKLKMISGTLVAPIGCYEACRSTPPEHFSPKDFDDDSLAGSVTMHFPRNPSPYDSHATSNSKKSSIAKTDASDTSTSSTITSDVTKVHRSGTDTTSYDSVPTCPSCIEMTCLASPFQNDKPILRKNPEDKIVEHECGLSSEHFCNPETAEESLAPEPLDADSFVSCSDYEPRALTESYASSGTLLASGESYSTSQPSSKSQRVTVKRENSFDILSISSQNSDEATETTSERNSVLSYDEVESVRSSDDTMSYQLITHHSKRSRAPSIQTFKSVIEHSVSSSALPSSKRVKSSKRDIPNTPSSSRMSRGLERSPPPTAMLKYLRTKFSPDKRRLSRSNTYDGALRKAKGMGKKVKKSGSLPKIRSSFLGRIVSSGSEMGTKAEDEDSFHVEPEQLSEYESDDTESSVSSLSTSRNFNSIPGSSLPGHLHAANRDAFMGNFIEEVGAEAIESEQYLDEFEDARSNFYSSSPDAELQVDPLSYSIAVYDKGTPADMKSVKSFKSDAKSSDKGKDPENNHQIEKSGKFIPMYEGEVIMPHPSKLPATAWLYPMQMISVPTTELAFEKGWEPGINKYTLYSIHYDIRIWPDLYSNQIMEASQIQKSTEEASASSNTGRESVPLIREIKRRYREFLYLHNRLSHGPMAKNMKGILRPNRRYAMPFGRMDPDVIEGRRKILEYYLVSLVSRPELCNSREFKEFLGAEGYDNVSFIKPKQIAAKKLFNPAMNKIVTDIKTTTFPGHKDHAADKAESGLNYQYFIHGYEVPRMFGYAENASMDRHSLLWLANYVDYCDDSDINRGEGDGSPGEFVMAKVEFVQKPKMYIETVEDVEDRDSDTEEAEENLGVRTSGDGAEMPDECLKAPITHAESAPILRERIVRFDEQAKKHDGRRAFDSKSIQIAALFSEELAAQLHEEKESLSLTREKDLFESSWPITDSVLSLVCEILKGYNSWLTFESVQQAILFGLGGVIEWLIGREFDEIVMKEKWFKYLTDLYDTIWDGDELRPAKPVPTIEQKIAAKEEALRRLIDIIPSFIMMTVGPSEYHKCCEQLLNTLQYQRINKHVLYAALEIILVEVLPEMVDEFPSYMKSTSIRQTHFTDKSKQKQ